MEEAVEYLVKIYLEKRGYLVITNRKYSYPNRIKLRSGKFQIQNSPIEIDIIAINPTTKDKIIGEVKGWFGSTGAYKDLFKKLGKGYDEKIDRFKVINRKSVQKAVFKHVERDYGRGFRYVLFIGNVYKPHRQEVIRFIDKLRINNKKVELIQFDQIMDLLIKEVNSDRFYENNIALQTIKILNHLDLFKKR